MSETFSQLVQRLEPLIDSIVEKPLKENLENVEEEYRRGHEPKPLPRDSKIVQQGRKVGVDTDGRHVFEFQGYYWSWDRMHGEWEVFGITTKNHLFVANEHGIATEKKPKRSRKLVLRSIK